ncbi:MAG: glycosyltransferase family 4 protein [Rhodobacterales bacterium]|nr:glycosyltransferase family 4 protein [Rhodobacterales bacterium]
MPDPSPPGLLVCLSYYHPNVSGLTISAAEQAEAFVRRGHPAAVISARQKGTAAREVINGVNVFRSWMPGRLGKAPIMPLYPLTMWRALGGMALVGIHMPCPEAGMAAVIARLRGRRVIISYVTSISTADRASRVVRAIAGVSHLVAGVLADRIQVVSKDYADNSTFCRLFRRKLRFAVIPTPFPPEDKLFQALKRPQDNGPLHIGYVGRLARQKSLGLLLDAFDGLSEKVGREVVLHLCGPASDIIGETDWQRTLQAADASDGRVRYHGVLHGAALQAFYGGLDLLVLPSTDRQESFGLVQVEAMLQGVPVVASDLPGMREPVRQTGMGLLSKPGDVDDLRACIARVLTEGPPQRADLTRLRALFGVETSCAPYFEAADQVARPT